MQKLLLFLIKNKTRLYVLLHVGRKKRASDNLLIKNTQTTTTFGGVR